MPFHTNQLGLGKRHWNLETSSAVVEFPPLYLVGRKFSGFVYLFVFLIDDLLASANDN